MTGLTVPDAKAAMAGLTGFTTAATLPDAHDAMVSSLKVVGGRFEHMAELFRTTANTFALASMTMPGTLKPQWMSQQIGGGLTAMGDLNGATTGP